MKNIIFNKTESFVGRNTSDHACQIFCSKINCETMYHWFFLLEITVVKIMNNLNVCSAHSYLYPRSRFKWILTKKYHTVGTVPKSNQKSFKRGQSLYPNTYMTAHWLGTCTSTKTIGVKLVSLVQPSTFDCYKMYYRFSSTRDRTTNTTYFTSS